MTPSDMDRLLERFNSNAPNTETESAINQLRMDSGILLPEDYVKILQRTNGGEGFIGPNAYIILWRVDELMDLNAAYHIAEYAPGLLIFGSDGGGEAFAFDMRSDAKPVVSIPFVGMKLSEARTLAPNFVDFLERLFRS